MIEDTKQSMNFVLAVLWSMVGSKLFELSQAYQECINVPLRHDSCLLVCFIWLDCHGRLHPL
jgi:hypothetical protein